MPESTATNNAQERLDDLGVRFRATGATLRRVANASGLGIGTAYRLLKGSQRDALASTLDALEQGIAQIEDEKRAGSKEGSEK